MEISKYLNEEAIKIPGKQQSILRAFARAFEAIPRQLAINAGFESVELLAKLRKKTQRRWYLVWSRYNQRRYL